MRDEAASFGNRQRFALPMRRLAVAGQTSILFLTVVVPGNCSSDAVPQGDPALRAKRPPRSSLWIRVLQPPAMASLAMSTDTHVSKPTSGGQDRGVPLRMALKEFSRGS